MQASSIKIAWKVILAHGIYIAVLGLVWIFSTKTIGVSQFTSSTGESWSDFLASNPKPAELLIMETKLLGAMVLVIGLFVVLVAWKSYSKAEKWSWCTFLVTGIIGWGSSLNYYMAVGCPTGLVMVYVGIVLFVIGIALPAKAILGKEDAGKWQGLKKPVTPIKVFRP